MSIKKQHLKNSSCCKVTFRLSKEAANHAKIVHLVGDFNGWDLQATPMKPLKSGEFIVGIELDTHTTEYQFRYLCDGDKWLNDPEADGYATNGIGSENSIVRV